ncbi:MAG: hypothetical protein ACFFDN_46210, partial [Candidatus Hodarchaeota archaeon]
MISWILFGIFSIWIIINRFREGGKVEGYPLSMPRGTVRALIAITIVAFPFGYIISGVEKIPPLIVNIIFVVVAFYFEARRSER